MKRRSSAGREPAKTRRRKTAASKRPNASKALRRRNSSAASLRKQLDDRTRERDETLQQQAATSEVLSVIRRSPADAQPVFDAIVESAARLCAAMFGAVYLCDDGRLRIAAIKNFTPGATGKLNELQQLKRPVRSHLAGRAILDRKIVHLPDVLEDPEYSRELALAGGWRAVLAVPLLRDGEPVGAVTVAKAEPTPFSDWQIQLLKTFADQALIAIENVRLFEAAQKRTRELTESLEQQTATSEVLKVISSSPGELEPVFQSMLEKATRICAAKFGTLLLCEGDAFRVVAMHNAPTAFAEMRWRQPVLDANPRMAFVRSTKSKCAVQIPDIASEPAYFERDPIRIQAVELGGFRAVLSVPMLKNGEPIGAFNIYRQEPGVFTDKQVALATTFAAQAVIAIENARLLNELRQRSGDLTESLEQQTATSEVLKVINSVG